MSELGVNEIITLAGVFLERSNEQNVGLYCSNNTRSLWLSKKKHIAYLNTLWMGLSRRSQFMSNN